MRETPEDIVALQELIDRSRARMGIHARSIMDSDRWSVPAADITRYLAGIRHLAVATVTARGEPRVAPVDGWFIRARFVFGSAANSVRMRHLRRNPAVSATHYIGDDVAVIVHGRAELIDREHPDAGFLQDVISALYGSSPFSWGDAVLLARIEPSTMITYSRNFAKALEAHPPNPRR